MTRVFLTASQDASIYEVFDNRNAGFDEILEIGKKQAELDDTNGAVRSLIKFDLSNLQGAPTSSTVILNLRVAKADRLYRDEMIYIYPVSESWDEGSGYFYHEPIVSDDGTTWRRNTSGSYWAQSGSSFLSTPVVSQSVDIIKDSDLRIDITSLAERIITGSADNYGFLLKFSDTSENQVKNKGNIKFFSKQTHTVHEPTLELVWDNQSFVTGSLRELTHLNVEIAPRNIQGKYYKGDLSKVYFIVRDKYPPKSFSNTDRFANKYYLPSGSQYSIVDEQAGTTIVPFDQYSRVDCDPTGSNVLLDTSPLYKNRYYVMRLKVPVGSQTIYTREFRFGIE